IFNYGYNPTGRYKAAEYRFPYDDESFDFVFLTSVFTHMLPWDMEHYFSEIGRVLRKGGRSFITFFLLNDESRELIHTGTSSIGFKHQIDGTAAFPEYKINDPDIPEAAVAYPGKYIKELHELNHLHIADPLRYGSWCGRKDFLSFQDIIPAKKR
ncbi:MAG: class I SAM-dependent methyltransferase, partial [bacterium]|nr:class I SAM-dependent methyltransferase [bacterium]